MQDTLAIILVLLVSSVLAVALFRALRLPTMLAYFLVGLALGLLTGNALLIVLVVSVLSMIAAPFIIQYNGRLARRLVKSHSRNHEDKVTAMPAGARCCWAPEYLAAAEKVLLTGR
jgi:Kef-type K+ transport system membrane component KefB